MYNSTLIRFLDMNETSLNAKSGIEDLSSFQSVLPHDLAYWDSFSMQVALIKYNLLTGIHYMEGWTTTAGHGVNKKEAQKD